MLKMRRPIGLFFSMDMSKYILVGCSWDTCCFCSSNSSLNTESLLEMFRLKVSTCMWDVCGV